MVRPLRTIGGTAALALAQLALLLAVLGTVGDAQQAAPAKAPDAPPGQAPAGSPAPANPQQPVFRSGIDYVRVDVIVSDKTGGPVGDLKASDFEITEDNKPQTIDAFKLVRLDGGTVAGPDGPPREIHNDRDEELEAARDDVRLFAVFLDDYHVKKGTSFSARNQLADFIGALGPSDMIGVMYPLEPISSVLMTRNRDAVSRAMQRFVGRKYDYRPLNQFEEQYARYPAETVERIRNEVSLSALKSLIVHMGSLKEGRKALVLVSEGYTNLLPPQLRSQDAQMPAIFNPASRDPLAGSNDPAEQQAQFSADADMQTDLRAVYDLANKNNVAIYAVDPRGLAVNEYDIDQNVGPQVDRQYLASTMDTLRVLSENTDGRAIVNRNDLAAGMKQVMRDSSAYYLIGYNSSLGPTDGKFHEIKVRVKRPGLQVRARKGYWAFSPEDAAKALAAPLKPSTPKAVDLALGAVNQPSRANVVRTWVGASRGENGKTRMTFVWEPVPPLPGERNGARDAGRDVVARVGLTAVGPDGAPYYRGKIADAGSLKGAFVSFDAVPGRMQLRVAAEGVDAQVLDSETREMTVPDLTSPQAFGTPQLLRARTIRELQVLEADPSAMPTPVREFARTERVVVRIPAYGPGGTPPALSVRLLNRAGQRMAQLPLAPAGAASVEQFEVPLASLAPGEYVVEITTSGAAAGDAEVKELVGFRVTG